MGRHWGYCRVAPTRIALQGCPSPARLALPPNGAPTYVIVFTSSSTKPAICSFPRSEGSSQRWQKSCIQRLRWMTLTQSHLVKSQHSSGKCAYISVIQPRSKVVKSLRTGIRLDSILSLHFFNASARTCYPHDLGATRWLHFSKNHPPHQDVFTLYHKSPILLRHVLFPRLDSCIMLPQDFKFLEPISVSTNLKYLIEVLIQFANALLPLSLFTFLLFLQKDLGRLLDSPNIFIGTNWSLAITSLLILGSSTFSVVLAQYPLLRRRNLSTYFERYYRNV